MRPEKAGNQAIVPQVSLTELFESLFSVRKTYKQNSLALDLKEHFHMDLFSEY